MHSTLPRHIKADILKALVLTGMAATSTGMAATPTSGDTQVVAVGGWGCLCSIRPIIVKHKQKVNYSTTNICPSQMPKCTNLGPNDT